MKIGESKKKGRTTSTMTGDIKMTTTTEGVRGAIANGIAIAFIRHVVALLIATTIIVRASLAKVGERERRLDKGVPSQA